MTPIREVAVVVPARNEETLLPSCLGALAIAAGNSPVPTRIVVVLDSCADTSADVCRRHGVEAIAVGFANVGQARHAGVVRALRSATSPSSLWIANTDADSRVPPDWLGEQVRHADDGADAVVGLVEIGPGLAGDVLRSHEAAYSRRLPPNGSHDHIHGANLGVRASTYLESGGFPPITDHEDRQLVARLVAMGHPAVITTTNPRVQTSGRSVGRCRDGFARSLAGLIEGADAAVGQ